MNHDSSSILIDVDEEDDFIYVAVQVVCCTQRKMRRLCDDGKGRVFRPRLHWNVHIERHSVGG